MDSPRQLLSDLIEALNDHDSARIRKVFAPSLKGQDSARAGWVNSPDQAASTLERYLHAFPDFVIEIQECIAGTESAAACWQARGTHSGVWMNVPPTGRRVQFEGVWMVWTDLGLISRFRAIWDVAGLLRELGLLPDL